MYLGVFLSKNNIKHLLEYILFARPIVVCMNESSVAFLKLPLHVYERPDITEMARLIYSHNNPID